MIGGGYDLVLRGEIWKCAREVLIKKSSRSRFLIFYYQQLKIVNSAAGHARGLRFAVRIG